MIVVFFLKKKKVALRTPKAYILITFSRNIKKTAISPRNESKFIERIYEDINNNKFFWFGSDSNTTVQNYIMNVY